MNRKRIDVILLLGLAVTLALLLSAGAEEGIVVLCVFGCLLLFLWKLIAWARGTSTGTVLEMRMFANERDWLIGFHEYMSRSLRAGTPLMDAITLRLADGAPRRLESRLRKLMARLNNGEPLSLATRACPGMFSESDRAIIEVGEKTGDLAGAFDYLAAGVRTRGLQYFPFALAFTELGFFLLLTGFVLVFIIPKFKDIFDQLGAELPRLTMLVIEISNVLAHDTIWVLLVLVALALVVIAVRNRAGWARGFLALFPPLRQWYWELSLSRFSYALGAMLRAGVPQMEAVQLAVTAAHNPIIEKSRGSILGHLMRGGRIDQAIATVPMLPSRIYWYIERGVVTEKLDDSLLSASEALLSEHQRRMHRMASILFPLFVIALGTASFVFVVAMYLPLFCIPKIVGAS